MCPDEVGIKFWFPAFGLAIFVRVQMQALRSPYVSPPQRG